MWVRFPIAHSISHDDPIGLTRLNFHNLRQNWSVNGNVAALAGLVFG